MCEPVTAWLASSSLLGSGTAATAAALTNAQVLGLAASAAGAAMGAIGAYNQASVAKQVAANNAKVAEMQAQDAERRGEKEAIEVQRRAAMYKSAQRASMGARGLDLTYGTAADLQDQTDFFGQIDANTARLNAAKEAWARRAQRSNFEFEAASSRPWMSAGSTLLTGAGQVADKWYAYRRG